MRTPFLLLSLGLVLVVTSAAFADEIRLKNGSSIHGRIVREDKDFVTIDLGRGRMSIARRDIVSINRAAPPPRDESAPTERKTREGEPPQDEALPTGRVDPRATVQNSRKRTRDRAPTGPNPRIVPVERTPRRPTRTTGPESATPSRQSASRTTSTSRKANAPSPTPDW